MSCDVSLQLGSAVRSSGITHTADAPQRTGRGCVSMHVRTVFGQQDHGRIFRSVLLLPWRVLHRTDRRSALDSRDVSRGAWVS